MAKMGERPGFSSSDEAISNGDEEAFVTQELPATETPSVSPVDKTEPWHIFVKGASKADIEKRFSNEANAILAKHQDTLKGYCCIALLDQKGSIENYELDKLFGALKASNPDRDLDVLLFLLSQGGNVEPAYQISKICKSFAREKFVVCVPRQAKSAATLIAIGADEIHMGALGQLGPIDPQLGGLPALGVIQALETVADLADRYPGSSGMFARYLKNSLTIEQIGYCERISKSAAQYAERLLLTKPLLKDRAKQIAEELVLEYKDHGFVIDIEEAQQHLGRHWILGDTPMVAVAEEIYNLFDMVNLFLGFYDEKPRRLMVAGSFDPADMVIFDLSKKQ